MSEENINYLITALGFSTFAILVIFGIILVMFVYKKFFGQSDEWYQKYLAEKAKNEKLSLKLLKAKSGNKKND